MIEIFRLYLSISSRINTFPLLAKSEIDINALLVSGFSTAGIFTFGKYQVGNVPNVIDRICKKLQVQSLDELLNAFHPVNSPGRFYPEEAIFRTKKQ